MAAMTDGAVYYRYTDAAGTQHTITLTYDATVTDDNGNVVGGWVGTETLPLGSSFKQNTKRTIDGKSVGVFSGTLWAVNNAGTSSENYTMADAGFEALGLRVKEQVAPTVTTITPTANQKFDTATPTFAVKIKDVGAMDATATTEGQGDSGIDFNLLVITLDGVNYSGADIEENFTTDYSYDSETGEYLCTATPKNALSTTGVGASHTVAFTIGDCDGNTTTTSTITFVCDVTAPTLAVTSPSSASVVTAEMSYHITGTTTDDETSPVQITVDVNGTEYTTTATGGTFDIIVQLTQNASNNVTITATNSAGLTTIWTGVIVQNNTVPVFDWVRVTPNPTNAGTVITITAFVRNGNA
ncbi:MAG: hypothetical protein K6G90_03135 [Clostridia bacterium]|nr:hypothetical protein [Clostridia bacterium]